MAKKRQGTRTDLDGNLPVNLPEGKADSRDAIGAAVRQQKENGQKSFHFWRNGNRAPWRKFANGSSSTTARLLMPLASAVPSSFHAGVKTFRSSTTPRWPTGPTPTNCSTGAKRRGPASKADYAEAYKWASKMVENWWLLGQDIPRLGISKGSGMKKRSDKSQNTLQLRDLGISDNQSHRCQKLAEFSKAELNQYLEDKYDEEKYYLPTLGGVFHAWKTQTQDELSRRRDICQTGSHQTPGNARQRVEPTSQHLENTSPMEFTVTAEGPNHLSAYSTSASDTSTSNGPRST